jgi:hypothetical protein
MLTYGPRGSQETPTCLQNDFNVFSDTTSQTIDYNDNWEEVSMGYKML